MGRSSLIRLAAPRKTSPAPAATPAPALPPIAPAPNPYLAFLARCRWERRRARYEARARRDLQDLCDAIADHMAANYREESLPDPPSWLTLYRWSLSESENERWTFEMALADYDSAAVWDGQDLWGRALERRWRREQGRCARLAESFRAEMPLWAYAALLIAGFALAAWGHDMHLHTFGARP